MSEITIPANEEGDPEDKIPIAKINEVIERIHLTLMNASGHVGNLQRCKLEAPGNATNRVMMVTYLNMIHADMKFIQRVTRPTTCKVPISVDRLLKLREAKMIQATRQCLLETEGEDRFSLRQWEQLLRSNHRLACHHFNKQRDRADGVDQSTPKPSHRQLLPGRRKRDPAKKKAILESAKDAQARESCRGKASGCAPEATPEELIAKFCLLRDQYHRECQNMQPNLVAPDDNHYDRRYYGYLESTHYDQDRQEYEGRQDSETETCSPEDETASTVQSEIDVVDPEFSASRKIIKNDLKYIDHWSFAIKNTKANRAIFYEALREWTPIEWQRLRDAKPVENDLLWALYANDIIVHHTGIRRMYDDLPFETPGALFYAHWDALQGPNGIYVHLSAASLEQARAIDAILKSAYHGTSLKALIGIANDGDIADAVNITQGKSGNIASAKTADISRMHIRR